MLDRKPCFFDQERARFSVKHQVKNPRPEDVALICLLKGAKNQLSDFGRTTFFDPAPPPAHRAYGPEGGPGFWT